MAALELTDRIRYEKDQKKIPFSVYLDLSKAFDTLNHSILLTKLKYHGIKDTPLDWFRSYLTQRFFDIQWMIFTNLQITPFRSILILYSDITAISMKSWPESQPAAPFSHPYAQCWTCSAAPYPESYR